MADETSVGRICLDLELNQKGFNRQLNGIQANIAGTSGKITKSFDGISGMAKKAGATIAAAFSIAAITGFTKSCLELGSDLAEVQNVVDTTFPNMSAKVDEWAKEAAGSFGLSETTAKQFTGTFGAMAKAFGFSEQQAYNMSTALTGLAGDVASFYNISQDEAYTKLKSVFSGETETLKDLGIVMTQSALDAYAMANGFGKTTSAMSEQEKVSLRLKFVTEQLSLAQGDFAKTSNSWANQVRILKLNFDSLKATMGQGFINLFTPIVKSVNAVINKLGVLAGKFKALTEFLTGKKVETGGMDATASSAANAEEQLDGAASAANNLADSTKKAAKASRQLMGFDKINKLSDTSSSKSDSSSSGTPSANTSGLSESVTTSLDSAFKDADVDKQVKKFAKKLKKAFKTGDFTEIGKIVGNKINNALDRINWVKIKKSAKKAAKSVATFLNGFFEKTNWKKLGGTIAEGLNTTVLTLDTFFTTFKWDKAATALAETFNGFVKKTNWNQTGKTIAHGINGITDYLITLLKKIDWKEAAGALKDTFTEVCKNLDWGDLAKIIGIAIGLKLAGIGAKIGINKIKTKFGEWVSGTLVKGLKEKLTGGVAGAGLETVTGEAVEGAVGTGIGTVGKAAGLLSKIAKFAGILGGCLASAIGGWKVGNWIYEAISGEDTSDIDWSDLTCFDEWPAAFKEMGKDIATWWDEHVVDGLVGVIEKAVSGIKKVKNKVVNVFKLVGKAATEKWNEVTADIKETVANIKAFFKDKKTAISSKWRNITGEVKDKTANLIAKVKSKIEKSYVDAKNEWDSWKDRVVSKIISAKKDVAGTWDKIKSIWDGWISGTIQKTVKAEKSGSFDKIKASWDKIRNENVCKKITLKAATPVSEIAKQWKKDFEQNFKPSWDFKINGVDGTVKQTMSSAYFVPKKADGGLYKNGKWKKITQYANGGIPSQGQMFIAREKGPELVGKIGNSTAVVNNSQIVASIASGVYKATAAATQAIISRIKTPTIETRSFTAPPLAVNSNRNNNQNQLETMVKQAAELSSTSGLTNQVIELLTQILAILKTLNLDLYIDGERVTKHIVNIINSHTKANGGRCEII